MKHGTPTGYFHGCCCDACRKAATDANNLSKARRIARGVPERVHGTPNGYCNYDCRCDRCRAAWAAYQHDRYAEGKKR